ncbi:hypothetical protein [Burkholderia sp. ABCPW 11]|uniref:hypothetical protein n=2 Tax=unclassified Burkholderia TaxID=2613784 RepID=UPI000A570ACA|nr:hypothetical protein [Burkholderia sp. ABCPW 11]
MASVTIDLGSGKRATLTRSAGSIGANLSASQRSDVSELMLHWPKYTGLSANALTYLRQLGLDAFSGVPLDALRAAIEGGRVTVEIDRQAIGGGGAAGGPPSTPPFPRANRLASVPSVASLPADKPLPSWATPSDVSAGDLMSYLESVVGAGGGAGGVADLAGGAGFADSSPLGDASPFDFSADALGDAVQVAGIDRGDMMACDIINAECKGSVLREFPGQYLNSTLKEIQGDASDGVKEARKALKLLNDNRFKK